jgi:glycosyltransferase involved in cell wall biosynthesis
MRSAGLWITWEKQRRNYGISKALGFEFYEFNYDHRNQLYRYIISIIKTIKLLYNKRPKVIVAQNPSIILALLAVFLKFTLKYKLLVDAHNSGLFPSEGKNKPLMVISRFIQRNSDVTIISNEKLRRAVNKNKGNAFILPDRIPDVINAPGLSLKGKYNIACICTYNNDEPYRDIIEAGRLLPNDIFIYFTGYYKNKIDIKTLPSNVKLLGFLSDEKYWGLLKQADIIMDLTLRENCLVCGAYEGLALKKPMILSDTTALKSYFYKGCVYVSSDKSSISEGIKTAIQQLENLEDEILDLKFEIEIEWAKMIKSLQARIVEL